MVRYGVDSQVFGTYPISMTLPVMTWMQPFPEPQKGMPQELSDMPSGLEMAAMITSLFLSLMKSLDPVHAPLKRGLSRIKTPLPFSDGEAEPIAGIWDGIHRAPKSTLIAQPKDKEVV